MEAPTTMYETALQPLDESHNEAMLAVMAAAPMVAGGLCMSIDRSPDIFAVSRLKYRDCMHLGFFSGSRLVGFASAGLFEAMAGGRPETLFSLFNFYLLPEARGKRLTERAVREFITEMKGRAKLGIALTVRGNRAVESYIGRQNESWMPRSSIVCTYDVRSVILLLPIREKPSLTVRNATRDDIPEIVRLLQDEYRQRDFAPLVSTESLEPRLEKQGLKIEDYLVATGKRGNLAGVCLPWDCNSFRRTVINSWSARFYPQLAAYRILEKVFNAAPFPSVGECLREITVTDYAVTGRDPAVMRSLLLEVCRRNCSGNYHLVNFGSFAGDPLLNAAKGLMFKDIFSSLIQISLDPSKAEERRSMPFFDIAYI